MSDKETCQIHRCFTLYGAIMGPMEAWRCAGVCGPLDLRMEQHSKNALKVARFLEGHPKVEKVYYPGLESSPSHGLAAKLFVDGAAAVCSVPILPAASRGQRLNP